ncbi:MAG: hypothetical protein WKG07_23640 [Hymenobacter sp.]
MAGLHDAGYRARLLGAGVPIKVLLPTGLHHLLLLHVLDGRAYFAHRRRGATSSGPSWCAASGLGLIFLPITIMSLAGLQGKDAGQAAGLTGMIRQLGGSFGVAIVGTYLERSIACNRVALLPNISLYNPETVQRIQAFTQSFISHRASRRAGPAAGLRRPRRRA